MPEKRTRKKKPTAEELKEALASMDVEDVIPAPRGRRNTVPPMLSTVTPGDADRLLEDYNPLRELLNRGETEDDICARTDVSPLQIIEMSRGLAFAEHFGSKELRAFIHQILILSMSKQRKSRREFVEAFRSSLIGEGAESVGVLAQMTQKLRS